MKTKTAIQTKARCYISTAGREFETQLKLSGRYTRPAAFREAYKNLYPNAPIEIFKVNELIITTTKKIKF